MMICKGVIFDFNGTLVYDSGLHSEAWIKLSKELRGYPFTDEELREYVHGRVNRDILKYLTGTKLSEQEIKSFSNRKEELYRELCFSIGDDFKLADGVENLLDYLVSNNIPHTIASSCDFSNMKFYIERLKLDKWFDIKNIVYDNGTFKGKPEPDIYLKAAGNIGVSVSECVVFEDLMTGIQSACRAKAGKIIAVASSVPKSYFNGVKEVSKAISDFNELKLPEDLKLTKGED